MDRDKGPEIGTGENGTNQIMCSHVVFYFVNSTGL